MPCQLPPAVAAARAHEPTRRVPFRLAGQLAGSVLSAHLPALRRWPRWLKVDAAGVELNAAAHDRSAALAAINLELHEKGLIKGWRDETYAVTGLQSGEPLARIERAAARFWGTLTCGAHATGYLATDQGRPTHVWIAQRSPNKATDPGLFDNLIGGGVPLGQSPRQALVREAWEEAGLRPEQLTPLQPGRVMHLCRDTPEGLQLEDLHAFDLRLPVGLVPSNQDGEVARFDLLPVADALALARGPAMTVDAALVMLDFAWRHALLAEPSEAAALFCSAGPPTQRT